MTFTSTLLPILFLALPLASSALELNTVNPDIVETGASPSTLTCPSAHLQDANNACVANEQCAAQYFLTDIKELETEVSLVFDHEFHFFSKFAPYLGANFT